MEIQIILWLLFLVLIWYFIYDYCSKRKKLSKDWKIINFTFFWIISFILWLFYAFFIRVMISVWVLFSMMILFNEIIPFKTETNEIRTESWKTIVFQWMTHLWTQEYYDKVEKIINEYTKEWFVVFFEWIQMWSEEESEKLNENLSINFTPELYEKVSWSFQWIVQQDYDSLFKSVEDSTKLNNVDMNVSEIVKWDQNESKKEQWIDMTQINETSVEVMSKARNNHLIQYILKWSLNLVSSLPTDIRLQFIKLNWWNIEFFKDKIINERNKYLANEVHKSENKKILIIYWQEHYKWFLEELKKIENVKLDVTIEKSIPFN